MIDKKTIGLSSLVSLGIVSIAMLIPGLFDEPVYYCESRPELGLIHCDDFSKYVSENGKCIRNDNTNLICRSGWIEVINDTQVPDEVDNTTINHVSWGQSYKIKQGQKPVLIEE